MESTLNRLISLNIKLEGLLRVAQGRPAPHALDAACEKFNEMSELFESLRGTDDDRLTEVKYDEAENGELAPNPEPTEAEVPASGEIVETDIEAAEVAAPKVAAAPVPRREDIRSRLTLNDKFLFKRELFNGSDAEMADTFALISSMDSAAEAREYLLHDMQWNEKDPTVEAFLNIVDSYFRS